MSSAFGTLPKLAFHAWQKRLSFTSPGTGDSEDEAPEAPNDKLLLNEKIDIDRERGVQKAS